MAEQKIPDTLNDLATNLASIHISYGDTKEIFDAALAKQMEHESKLDEFITKVKQLYSV